MKKNKKPGIIRRFVSYYRGHIPLFVLDMFCALIISAVDVFYPLMARGALNDLVFPGAEHLRPFVLVIAAAILMHVVRAVCNYIVTYYGHLLGVYIEADMRHDVFSHMQKLGFSFYDKSRTGKLMARCTTDLFDVVELAHHGPEDLFISLVTFIGSFIAMASINLKLALLLMATIPFMVAFVMYLRKQLNLTSRKVKESIAGINSDIESAISGVRVACW